jgi:hypoxanthine phosphoribosyltransferase
MSDPSALSLPENSRILISEALIQARVRELAAEITHFYSGDRPVLLGIMNGALLFLADLLRAVDLDTEISCVRLASYAGTQSTGIVRGLDSLAESFAGRKVLIIDDVLDTGRTLAELIARLRELGAEDVRSCVLLQKDRHRTLPVRADWIGFKIADEFVVGYGLDYNGRFRGLKDIRTMKAMS